MRTDEKGAVIIEFAFVAPLLIMLTLGVVQISFLLLQQQTLQAAAREGARTASFPSSTSVDIQLAINRALSAGGESNPTIIISPGGDEPCDGRRGEPVKVELQTTAELDIPFLAGQTVSLSGAGTFRCE